VSHEGVVPCTVVVAVSLPAVSTSESEVMPATALMSGASTGEESADTSAVVKVDAEPSAPRTPVLDVEAPGVTVRTLEPRALISEVTWPEAPSPRPTAMMTPAMPMRMPRTVRKERRRWLRTPLTPVRKVSSQFIGRSPGTAGRSP
jgi:hypothetical protein